jgi:hypothetical protein
LVAAGTFECQVAGQVGRLPTYYIVTQIAATRRSNVLNRFIKL